MELDKMEKIEGMLSVGIEQLVAYIYSITLGEMTQEELQNAAERATKLTETIGEIIVSMVQYDALAYRLLTKDYIERKFRINIEIGGNGSLTWSIPA
ncbi:MAG: hypothetical protein ACP5UN_00620 [Candidatus Micrarchaeia archaeon]